MSTKISPSTKNLSSSTSKKTATNENEVKRDPKRTDVGKKMPIRGGIPSLNRKIPLKVASGVAADVGTNNPVRNHVPRRGPKRTAVYNRHVSRRTNKITQLKE